MAKRQSVESIILEYFQTAGAEKAEVMFNLIKGVVKKQYPGVGARKRRTKKVNSAPVTPSKQTSFEPKELS